MRALLIATTIAALLTTTAAIAQQSTQPMMGQQVPMMNQGMMNQGMMNYGVMGHGMMPMMDPSQHIEGRLAFLKTELKITEAQAPQWTAYAEALRANAKRMGQLMTEMMSSGMMNYGMVNGNPGGMTQGQPGTMMSLPDRLAWAEQHMAAHMEMLQAIKGPTEELYAVLSAEQKHVADQIMGPMGMMGMM
jgi:LTXXQ motif family protein